MTEEIKFANVRMAVMWAEELAAASQVKSQLGALLAKPGAGNLTRQDKIDIAQTISMLTGQCKPFKGAAMKAIYGCRDSGREHQLGLAIAGYLAGLEAGKGKKYNKLVRLGEATIRSVRFSELLGKRYGINRMAKDVGVSRERFYKAESWRTLRHESKQLVFTWLEDCENELWLELDVRGWMS